MCVCREGGCVCVWRGAPACVCVYLSVRGIHTVFCLHTYCLLYEFSSACTVSMQDVYQCVCVCVCACV